MRTGENNQLGFSPTYLRYALGPLFLVNVVNYMDRSVIGVLIEPMRADLQLTDTQIGVLTGFAFAVFYAVGRRIHRPSRRRSQSEGGSWPCRRSSGRG